MALLGLGLVHCPRRSSSSNAFTALMLPRLAARQSRWMSSWRSPAPSPWTMSPGSKPPRAKLLGRQVAEQKT
jgi:hypothetical protein